MVKIVSNLIISTFLLLLTCNQKTKEYNQNNDSGENSSSPKLVETTYPIPLMGDSTFVKYLNDSLRYPEEALRSEIEAVVSVNIEVDVDSSVRILAIFGPGYGMEQEVRRLIKGSGKWIPAYRLDINKPIKYSYLQPVVFKLPR